MIYSFFCLSKKTNQKKDTQRFYPLGPLQDYLKKRFCETRLWLKQVAKLIFFSVIPSDKSEGVKNGTTRMRQHLTPEPRTVELQLETLQVGTRRVSTLNPELK